MAPTSSLTAGYLLPTALVKQGAGTLTLTQSNVFWGPTLIQQGIVNVQNNNALGATGNEVQTISVTGAPEAGLTNRLGSSR